MRLAAFAPGHLGDVIRLCEREGWTTFVEDPQRTLRALMAPGVVTLVAVLDDGEVVGFAQALTDGAVQAYLARLVVAEHVRRRGVGQRLLQEALARSNALRVDLLAADGSDEFYGSFPHRQGRGYRIALEEEGEGLASWPRGGASDPSAPALGSRRSR